MSPRKGPRRPQLAVRVAAAGISWLDARAAEEGIRRSELVRRMLVFAERRMPKGWKP